jgi:hypothetical protein
MMYAFIFIRKLSENYKLRKRLERMARNRIKKREAKKKK